MSVATTRRPRDKLRAGVAALFAAFGERGTQHNNAFTHLVAFVKALDLENPSDDELQGRARNARTIVYEDMADVAYALENLGVADLRWPAR
jgi:hypothetical protein